ncbi:MAG: hypothetical protein LQ342_006551 [Letrouitia transgressa]|nr:MAG: hypothetical protein LQ342_006551 [Letrouitia transgressa]
MADLQRAFGWLAQPRNPATVLHGKRNVREPVPQKVSTISVPSSPLTKAVLEYAEKELPHPTFNHSMRVYYYGKAMHIDQFPDWQLSDETYLLTCLLHDIGTTDKNLTATLMSFEFYGGMLALNLLKELQAPVQQAEGVAEAIMRHQDLGETGKITTIGLLIQMATIFDNMGGHSELVHKETIEDVVKHYPRQKWSSCFASTIRKENELKPWAHTTALGEEDFPNGVQDNQLMAPYD